MDRQLALKLTDAFPGLYRRRDSPDELPSHFSFDCGDGWYQLIHDLSADLLEIAARSGINPPLVEEVKSKYGGMRFYASCGSGEMDERIDRAEADSEFICEKCGMPGRLREEQPWIRTLCNQHADS